MSRDASGAAAAGSPIDEFEQAFENVCQYLQPMDDARTSLEEVRADAGNLIGEFLEAGKAVERYFLQKRLVLTHARPEQVLKEECNELKQEIFKKEQLIHRHHDKVQSWKLQLRSPATAAPPLQPPQVSVMQQQSQAAVQQQQQQAAQQQSAQQQQLLQQQQLQMQRQQQFLQEQQQQQQQQSMQWPTQQQQQQWPGMQQQPPPYSTMGASMPAQQTAPYGGQGGSFGPR